VKVNRRFGKTHRLQIQVEEEAKEKAASCLLRAGSFLGLLFKP
jgi:hypothetical protein